MFDEENLISLAIFFFRNFRENVAFFRKIFAFSISRKFLFFAKQTKGKFREKSEKVPKWSRKRKFSRNDFFLFTGNRSRNSHD